MKKGFSEFTKWTEIDCSKNQLFDGRDKDNYFFIWTNLLI